VTGATKPVVGLHAAALQAELARHARRLAELKAMAPKLRMLDEFVPTLQARGIDLQPDQLACTAGPALRICAGMFDATNWALFDALQDAGFVVMEVAEFSTFADVRMRNGRLRVRMHVSKDRPLPVAPA
jgi:hypothetical protein